MGWWKTTWAYDAGVDPARSISRWAHSVTCRKYAGSPVNRPEWLGYRCPSRRQKSGVSVVYERVRSTRAITLSRPMTNAAPPALAEYSSASPGAPWEVSEPIATPYLTIPEATRPRQLWIAAVPALQANSKSAAVRLGVAPTAEATTVAVGFTAYGWDSEALWTEVQPYQHFIDIQMPNPPDNASGIFLHDDPTAGDTAGCVALPNAELDAVLAWLDPAADPHILIAVG